jgi:hypothetical protein
MVRVGTPVAPLGCSPTARRLDCFFQNGTHLGLGAAAVARGAYSKGAVHLLRQISHCQDGHKSILLFAVDAVIVMRCNHAGRRARLITPASREGLARRPA